MASPRELSSQAVTVQPPRSTVAAFAAEPSSSGQARRFVRDALRHMGISDAVIVDKAVLVASELVTNAVLHAQTGPVITVRTDSDLVRIEVEDCSEEFPLLRNYGNQATTGRGLAVIEASANWWGVESTQQGKTVWAEFSLQPGLKRKYQRINTAMQSRPLGQPENIFDDGQGDAEELHHVVFARIPVQGFLELEQHARALFRELELLSIGVDNHLAAKSKLPSVTYRLSEAVKPYLTKEFDTVGKTVRAAQDSGLTRVDVGRQCPAIAVRLLDDFERLVTEAGRLIDCGLLLTQRPSPVADELRLWLRKELRRQIIDGLEPLPAPAHLSEAPETT
jgi:anti-sigma regulatory factor (Ser/Thr protein kinase)